MTWKIKRSIAVFTFNFSCGVKWNVGGSHPLAHFSYVTYIYTFGFLIPVTIIFTSYYKIIKAIKYKASLMKATGVNTQCFSPGNKSRIEKDRRLTIMVAIMVSS